MIDDKKKERFTVNHHHHPDLVQISVLSSAYDKSYHLYYRADTIYFFHEPFAFPWMTSSNLDWENGSYVWKKFRNFEIKILHEPCWRLLFVIFCWKKSWFIFRVMMMVSVPVQVMLKTQQCCQRDTTERKKDWKTTGDNWGGRVGGALSVNAQIQHSAESR